MKKALLLLLALTLIPFASAKVGVVVEFPNGTVYTACVDASDGANAYQILQRTGLDADWTDDGMWGRALCKIGGIGSDPSGDACSDWSSYWAFSLSLDRDDGWTTHSPVGFTAGSCWNRDYETPSYDGHYCAQDGDVIGLHYTNAFPSGHPNFESFAVICEPGEEDKGPIHKAILMSSRPYWKEYCEECEIEYDETMQPQTLRDLCEEKLAKMNASSNITNNATDSLNITGNETHLDNITNTTPRLGTISYTYSPKEISTGRLFTVFFSTGGVFLTNLPVTINGVSYTTDLYGAVSFKIASGDYLIEASYPGFEDFKVIFRFAYPGQPSSPISGTKAQPP